MTKNTCATWPCRLVMVTLFYTLWSCGSPGSNSRETAPLEPAGNTNSVIADNNKTNEKKFVENSGADCPLPMLPAAAHLPVIAKLPDPFSTLSGEPISTRQQWPCLRQQTNQLLQEYEAGIKPSKPAVVNGVVTSEAISVDVEHEGQRISFNARLTLPAKGDTPYPAIIGVGVSSLNNDYLANHGIAIISIDNNALGAQAGGDSRGTGLFYDLYGSDHSASSMTAWSWGVSRLIDVIASSDAALIDPARLGVTGCSRNGKGALLAGAMDERIALTIVQESGAGGAVSWRVAQKLADSGANIQTLSHAAGEQPWFRESFGENFGGTNLTRLPFDHHQLMGMVAPRGLLILDNPIDWLGPEAAFISTIAAKEIFRALGAEDNIAYSEVGGHGHCQLPDQQLDVLSAFVQRFLLDQPGNTAVMRSTQSDAETALPWIDWETPTLK